MPMANDEPERGEAHAPGDGADAADDGAAPADDEAAGPGEAAISGEAPAKAAPPDAERAEAAPATVEPPAAAEPSTTEPPAGEPPAGEPPAAEPPAGEPPAEEVAAAAPPEPVALPVTVYGDGTPLLLLHTFPLDSRMWLPQIEALGGYQVLVPDLRGFGAAREWAVEVADMDLLADDVVRLLDERNLGQVVLCGLSMGGYVALAFARRHPERLGGLVLCGTQAGADNEEGAADRLAMAERVLAEGVGFMPEVMLPRLLGETARKQRPDLVEQVTDMILDQDPRGIAGAQRGMAARTDSTPTLAEVNVPTLVIVGDEDESAGPHEGLALATGIRDARLVEVEGAGHLVNLEQPDAVNEALLDFIAPLWI
jgi:3-oxoadipate enol-lactonase